MARNTRTTIVFASGMLTGAAISMALAATATESSKPPVPMEELKRFATVFNAIKDGYVEPLEDKRLVGECIKGMVSGVDPESAYLDEAAVSKLRERSNTASIGLELAKRGDFVKVIAPIEGSPAHKAGVKTGDILIKIDGSDTKAMTLTDAVERLRGDTNTDVELTVQRPTMGEPRTFVLRREVVKINAVRSR